LTEVEADWRVGVEPAYRLVVKAPGRRGKFETRFDIMAALEAGPLGMLRLLTKANVSQGPFKAHLAALAGRGLVGVKETSPKRFIVYLTVGGAEALGRARAAREELGL
jgi:predicted transcriptional regulator